MFKYHFENFERDFLRILIFNFQLYTPPSIFELETWNFTTSYLKPIANNPWKPIFEFLKITSLVGVWLFFVPQKNGFLAFFRLLSQNLKIGFQEVLASYFRKLHVKFQVFSSKNEGGVYKSVFFRRTVFVKFSLFISM